MNYFTNLIVRGLSQVLQSLITRGIGKQEIPLNPEDQNIIIKGLSLLQQKLIVKGFSSDGVTADEDNNIVIRGLSILSHNLITRGFDTGIDVPVTPTRHGGTVVGLPSSLSIAVHGTKVFKEDLCYQCKAEIHKPVDRECLVFGSKQFKSVEAKKVEGKKAFAVASVQSIIAQSKHLTKQAVTIKGSKKFITQRDTFVTANRRFDSKLNLGVFASRKFDSKIQNLITASRIQNVTLTKNTKGKRDLFPILFAAVDTYSEIFTD